MENKEVEKKRDKQLLDYKGRTQEVHNTIKHKNIRIIGIQKKRKEREGQKVFWGEL